ncbi:MAG: toll/interleukin-1 receptor domain-containing protein [Piscinibacter sp.]|nr:toll/interleukin-1 receptor domain-containing protein [Piscinibacter sp.]
MPDIFLSYRRKDSASATGRLADRLEEHFGPARVFHDHESILAGDDFAEAIHRAINVSTVVLAIIGPDWLDARDAQGARRLDDRSDFVRLEIESALEAGVAVVPVLVEGAAMPTAAQLPRSLAAFARCQAVELSDTRWRYDADRLIAMLQSRYAIESVRPMLTESTGQTAALGPAARLALDLLELATHPTRLIARRQTGHVVDHVRAFVFLLTCLLIGNTALLIGMNVHPTPSSIGGTVGGIVGWLASGELIGLILITLLAVPLTLAWRATGLRIEFRQITLILAHVYGGAWLGLTGGLLVLGFGVQMVDATLFDRVVALLGGRTPDAAATLAERVGQAEQMLFGALHGPAGAVATVTGLTWFITAVWAVVAWGSFRLAFGTTRLRAAAATLLWLAMLGALGWLSWRLAR